LKAEIRRKKEELKAEGGIKKVESRKSKVGINLEIRF